MFICNISVKRPVLSSVVTILIIIFGIISFFKLPVREYPYLNKARISIETIYNGASAETVENKITRVIEDNISSIEGIRTISSSSIDARSNIVIDFNANIDINEALSDIRDKISKVTDKLPLDSEMPVIEKSDDSDDVMMWFNLESDDMSLMEITDYADRFVIDNFSSIGGIARVRVGGGQEMSVKILLNKEKLLLYNINPIDIEKRILEENIELPLGVIEGQDRDIFIKLKREYNNVSDLENLIIKYFTNGEVIRLKDVSEVKISAIEERVVLRGNKKSMVGIGIIKRVNANALDVANDVRKMVDKLNNNLPSNLNISESYDSTDFIKDSIKEIYKTLITVSILVVIIIYFFLGNVRAMIIPALIVPISIIGTMNILYLLGYSINLITLFAIIISIGLVVDDAIVMVENIYRYIEKGEKIQKSSLIGSNEVSFAIISTSLVLVSVFLPMGFSSSFIGKLFKEFSVAICSSIFVSTFVALTFSVTLSSKLLIKNSKNNFITNYINNKLNIVKNRYKTILYNNINNYKLLLIIPLLLILSFIAFNFIPKSLTPSEDRGVFLIFIKGEEGSVFEDILEKVKMVEDKLYEFVESEEIKRIIFRLPGSFSSISSFDSAIGIIVLNDFDKRDRIYKYVGEMSRRVKDIDDVIIFPIIRTAFRSGYSKSFELVIKGENYDQLLKAREYITNKMMDSNNFTDIDSDYKDKKPQLEINIKNNLIAELGLSINDIISNMQIILASKSVSEFIKNDKEYEIIIDVDREYKDEINDLNNIYIRNKDNKMINISDLIDLKEFAEPVSLNRYNKLKSITIEANLKSGYSLDQAILDVENFVKEGDLNILIDYKGEILDFKDANNFIYITFLLSIIIIFLILSAQFESFIQPIIIMSLAPIALFGGIIALYIFIQSINIYSQIALIILIGIAVKNSILIVEFINQLRSKDYNLKEAIVTACLIRLRPVIMTATTTIISFLPFIFTSGAGSETRFVIGVTIFFGVLLSVIFMIFLLPITYYFVTNIYNKLKNRNVFN